MAPSPEGAPVDHRAAECERWEQRLGYKDGPSPEDLPSMEQLVAEGLAVGTLLDEETINKRFPREDS